MTVMDKAQENISGDVQVQLYKGSAYPIARTSENALYDPKQSSMDEEGGYDQKDAQGFIRINAVRLRNNSTMRGSKAGAAKSKAA